MKPKPTPPAMAEQLVPDDIWEAMAPLLPAHPPQPNGGRPLDLGSGGAWRPDLCAALQHALAAVARSGAGLRQPSPLLAAAAGLATGWRWEQLHHRLLDWLGDDGQIDWSRAALDSLSVRAKHGGS